MIPSSLRAHRAIRAEAHPATRGRGLKKCRFVGLSKRLMGLEPTTFCMASSCRPGAVDSLLPANRLFPLVEGDCGIVQVSLRIDGVLSPNRHRREETPNGAHALPCARPPKAVVMRPWVGCTPRSIAAWRLPTARDLALACASARPRQWPCSARATAGTSRSSPDESDVASRPPSASRAAIARCAFAPPCSERIGRSLILVHTRSMTTGA
jgi:hypothetical protein